MSEAFDPVPEPDPAAEEPLQAMASFNERLLRHCASLRRLVLYLGEVGLDAQAREAAAQMRHFFDVVMPQHHADEEQDLVPALLESMAGSDAVCIREIGAAVTLDHRELRGLWLQLRPALDAVLAGDSATLPAHTIEAFIERCQACVSREEGELLPMAERLLTDGLMQDIAAGMRGRRAAR
jgi:hemerythrin-like domain-containing protein